MVQEKKNIYQKSYRYYLNGIIIITARAIITICFFVHLLAMFS